VWLGIALRVATTVYLVLAAVIIVGRLRYDRRQRLIARIAELVAVAAAAPDYANVESSVSEVLRNWRPRAIELAMAEGHAAGAVRHACATWLFDHLGESRLRARAARGTARWKRISALRIVAFAKADAAWELLERAVSDDDREIVRAAVVILGQLPDRRSADLLVSVLSGSRHPRSLTAVFLQARAENLSALLAPLLTDLDPTLRYWAAVLVPHHPPVDAEARLVILAGDPDPSVRRAALESLTLARFVTALPVVLKCLDDSVSFVRAHAARALGHLGDITTAPVLAARLGDDDWWVRDAVKQSLVRLGRGAEPVLFGHLSDEDGFARNGAAEALQHLGTFERLLFEEAEGPPDAHRHATLGKLADAGGLRVWGAVTAHLPDDTRRRATLVLDALARRAAMADGQT
jgi:HEAT repeat protein